jgi:hypothetical protein
VAWEAAEYIYSARSESVKTHFIETNHMLWLRILYKTSLLIKSPAILKSLSSWCAATLHSSFSSGIWSLFGLLCWNQHWWSAVISPHGLIFVRGILNWILSVVGNRSHSRVFGIGTVLRAGWPGFQIVVWLRDFSVLQKFRPALGPTPPPIHWVPGFFPGVKLARALS